MTGRMHAALTLLIAFGVAAGGVFLQREVGPRPETVGMTEPAASGTWYCPHGGGPEGWTAAVTVANPGEDTVQVRVRSLEEPGAAPELQSVPPRSELTVSVPAERRAGSTVVEYFGGWVAAAWTTTAGGDERGTAAEPCLPRAGRSWLLPDGTTEEGQSAYVVVMNPFSADAVFTVQLVTEDRRIRTRDWTDVVLAGGHSVVFHLNTKALGERTAAAEVVVSIGRVAAASLGVTEGGGTRSAVGLLGGGRINLLFPGDADEGRSALAVLNAAEEGAAFSVSVRPGDGPASDDGEDQGPDGEDQATDEGEPAPGIPEEVLAPGAAATYDLPGPDPAFLELHVTGDVGLAAVRRGSSSLGDQASTPGTASPRAAWVLIPAHGVPGGELLSVLLLANPGDEAVEVSLIPLPGGSEDGGVTEVMIPPGSMVSVTQTAPDAPGSVLAVARGGTFVALARSTAPTEGGYALSLGVPVPDRWIPR